MSCATRWIAALAVLGCLSVPASRVSAQDPYHCIEDLTDDEVTYRIRELERELTHRKAWSRAFFYGWTLGFAALISGEIGIMIRADGARQRATRTGMGISLAGATVSLTQHLAAMFPRAFAPQRLRRMPESTPEQRRAKLRYATRTLERGAMRESFQSGVLAHGSGWVWGLGWGTFMMLRFDEYKTQGAITLVGSILVTEARILSMPTLSVRAWDAYRGGACHSLYMPPHVDEDSRFDVDVEDEGPEVQVSAGLGSLGMTVSF
jgi:hypothetical protein